MTKVEFETSEEVDVTPTFDTMGLREDLLRGIYAYGARRGGRGEGGGGEGGGEGNGGGDEGRRACAAARCNGRVPAGFEKPSAIQQRAIKQIIKGRDVIAQYVGGGGGLWGRAGRLLRKARAFTAPLFSGHSRERGKQRRSPSLCCSAWTYR